MKKLRVLLLATSLVSMSFSSQDGISDTERKAATDYLKQTRDVLLKKVKGLSADQLNYKPDADTWSVAECMEHIAMSEGNLFGLVQMTLKNDEQPEKEKLSDDMVVKIITDRSTKIKTNEQGTPKNTFDTYDGSVKEFKEKREAMIKYVKSTQDDLRNHYFEFPFGVTDAYQIIMFTAGHTARHTAQIEEVMANANFPTK